MALDFASVTAAELLECAPRLEVQLVLAFIQAIFWFLAIKYGGKLVEAWTRTWSAKVRDQWIKLNQETGKSFFVDMAEPEAYEGSCRLLVILMQHSVGGSLCVPSVFGLLPGLASTLACHGALCEVGWEVQDYLARWYDIIFFGEAGKARNPPAIMMIMTLHHAMGTLLVVPMNLHFRESQDYHGLVFLLQAAAFGAMALQQFGFTLDLQKKMDLITMKILVSITLALMLWSRLFGYLYVAYSLLVTLRAEGGNMFYMGLVVTIMMSLLNILLVVDAVGKFAKYICKSTLALRKQLSNIEPSLQTTDEPNVVAQEALTALIPNSPPRQGKEGVGEGARDLQDGCAQGCQKEQLQQVRWFPSEREAKKSQ